MHTDLTNIDRSQLTPHITYAQNLPNSMACLKQAMHILVIVFRTQECGVVDSILGILNLHTDGEQTNSHSGDDLELSTIAVTPLFSGYFSTIIRILRIPNPNHPLNCCKAV